MIWAIYVKTIVAFGWAVGGVIGPLWTYQKQIRRVCRFCAATVWCPTRKAVFASVVIVPLFGLAQMTPGQLTKQAEDHEKRIRRIEQNYRDLNTILTGRHGLQDQIEVLTMEHRQVSLDVADIKTKISNTLTILTVVMSVLAALATWGRIAWSSLKDAARRETGEQPHV